jgi:hypothetical protein
LDIESVDDFIELIKQRQIFNDKFIYLKKVYDNYNLEIISYPEIESKGMNCYYTLSCRGVSLFENEELKEFIHLG